MGETADWGIVATVRAPRDEVLAFVAHHLELSPKRIWIFLDDPADPVFETLQALDRVTPVRCDRAYWKVTLGKRPDTHQVRQTMNIRRVYRESGLKWIAHFDVDEFLLSDQPLAPILAAEDRATIRIEPWDALYDPAAPADIFTARHFRRGLRPDEATAMLGRLYGEFGALLPKGMLGHSAGKCFFRTGIEDFKPSIHRARFMGQPFDAGPFEPGLALLHFHAETPERWLDRLEFRLEKGAYRAMPKLQEFLRQAPAAVRRDFYTRVQVATPVLLSALKAEGFLREESLGLRAKVERLITPTSADPAA